jgi:hypothetical protein
MYVLGVLSSHTYVFLAPLLEFRDVQLIFIRVTEHIKCHTKCTYQMHISIPSLISRLKPVNSDNSLVWSFDVPILGHYNQTAEESVWSIAVGRYRMRACHACNKCAANGCLAYTHSLAYVDQLFAIWVYPLHTHKFIIAEVRNYWKVGDRKLNSHENNAYN